MFSFNLVSTIKQEAEPFLSRHGLKLFYEAHYLGDSHDGIVVFTSQVCKLQFTVDRGVVQAYVGPLSAPMPGCPDSPQQWFDLLTVVPFVTSGQETWKHPPENHQANFGKHVRKQIAALVVALERHWPAISQTFSRDAFPGAQPGLIEIETEGQRRFLENAHTQHRP